MKKILYPGSFDPIHNGHLDIARRASKLFDEFVFVVAVHPTKKPLFTKQERIKLIQDSTSHFKNVSVLSTEKLIVDLAIEHGAVALIRGLRHVSDFELEFQMAMMNYHLSPEVTTILMMPEEKHIHLNSNLVKEIARLHGDIEGFVPPPVYKHLKSKFD